MKSKPGANVIYYFKMFCEKENREQHKYEEKCMSDIEVIIEKNITQTPRKKRKECETEEKKERNSVEEEKVSQ
jgi:hypothetical protein